MGPYRPFQSFSTTGWCLVYACSHTACACYLGQHIPAKLAPLGQTLDLTLLGSPWAYPLLLVVHAVARGCLLKLQDELRFAPSSNKTIQQIPEKVLDQVLHSGLRLMKTNRTSRLRMVIWVAILSVWAPYFNPVSMLSTSRGTIKVQQNTGQLHSQQGHYFGAARWTNRNFLKYQKSKWVDVLCQFGGSS